MATICKLMEGKEPGEIRIRQGDWPPLNWFRPYYDTKGWWWGIRESEESDSFVSKGGGDYWELYTEPKQKVTWVEYLIWNEGGGPQGDTRWMKEGNNPLFGSWKYALTGRKIEV